MNIFEQYGIKEVADVVLYSIELDENDDEVYIPVIYLDTLKISSVEETAEQTSARGGLGNPELIIWDYGKDITISLQDALYSPASQGMTWGGKYGSKTINIYGRLQYNTGTKTYDLNGYFKAAHLLDYQMTLSSVNTKIHTWILDGAFIGDDNEKVFIDEFKAQCAFSGGREVWTIGTNNRIIINEENNILGTFTISNDQILLSQEMPYEIDHSLNNVYFLDRMEKCIADKTFVIDTDVNTQHSNCRYLEEYSQCSLTVYIDPRTMQAYEPNTDTFVRKNGETIAGQLRVIKQGQIYYKWTRTRARKHTSLGHQITIDATNFPGSYRLVGEAFSRNRNTGKDQRFQFEVPLCKMGTENSFTLEAEGEPTTFDMTLKVLRRQDGTMMKLTQYSVENTKYDGFKSASTSIVSGSEVVPTPPSGGD